MNFKYLVPESKKYLKDDKTISKLHLKKHWVHIKNTVRTSTDHDWDN